MNRPRPQQRPHRLDKDGSHRKRKRQPDKEKMLCTENQIRGSQSFTFFSVQAPPLVPPLHPPASVKCTAAARESANNALHCCAELSSEAFVFFDLCDRWETHVFFCRGSFRTGLPLGGDPCVHHGVTRTEDKHELELLLSFSSRSALCCILTVFSLLFTQTHSPKASWEPTARKNPSYGRSFG